ncbi:MAG: hypothetical protein WKF86_00665 [Acidimicrobiales bacterium]
MAPALAAAGALDFSFDIDGKQTTDFGGTGLSADEARALVIDANSKTVAVGGNGADSGFALARHDSTGNLDTTFDTDGKQTTHFPDIVEGTITRTITDEVANAVALAADGKIVVAGTARVNGYTVFAVARYTTAGALDPTFDLDGMVITNSAAMTDGAVAFKDARGVAIDASGNIVVVGSIRDVKDGVVSNGDFTVLRYTASGALDTSFGSGGIVTTDMQEAVNVLPNPEGTDVANAVVIAGGKILVAGRNGIHSTLTAGGGADTDFAFARYNSDGSLDTSFDLDGKAFVDAGYQDGANALAVQGDGKIVAAGDVVPSALGSQGVMFQKRFNFALVRLEANGLPDVSFANQGSLNSDFSGGYDTATGVALQADGRIVAAGWAETGLDTGSYDFALARFTANGSADSTFDTDGRLVTDFGGYDRAFGVAIYPSGTYAGRITAVGSGSTGGDFALARYLAS